MSNRFFDWVASASRFISYTWARAAEVNASLDNVSTGFTLAQAEIDENKTRSIRLPVGQDGDIPTTAANRARRVLTFDASGLPCVWPTDDAATRANKVFAWDADGNPILASNGAPYAWLPTQTGNSGKFLTTNGSDPSWALLGMTRTALTGTASMAATDIRKLFDCSGTFTITFAAPATLGADWYAIVRNTGSGNVTVSHTSGNIDGLTSYVMYPGEARLFQCDGSTIRSEVLKPFRLFGTTSTTMTMPPGYTRLGFDLHGGGAGGQNGGRGAAASATFGGGGGPGGGRHTGTIEAPSAGTTITLTKGDGGSGVAGRTTDGNPQSGGSGSASTIAWSSVTRASAGGATAAAAGSTQYPGGIVTADLGTGPPGYIGGATGAGAYANGSTPGATDGGSTPMGGAGGGGGGGRPAGAAYGYQGSAGGLRGSYPRGGGGAAGAAVGNTVAGNHGSTPTDGGGGGGSAATGNNAGNGAAGAGYGSGGGGGGACDTGYTSGAGGAGTGGYFDIWGIV